MFCPRCGQEQTTVDIKFCSRCGFLLTGVLDLISNNGLPTQTLASPENKGISPRKKGLRQGGQLLLSGLIIVPILLIIIDMLRIYNSPIVAIIAILTFWGGILRMLYARIFESNEPTERNSEAGISNFIQNILNKGQAVKCLTPEQSTVDDLYVPSTTNNWRDSRDLVPHTVTDHTTKLLEKDR